MTNKKPLSDQKNVSIIDSITKRLLIVGTTILILESSTAASQEKRNIESNIKTINEKTTVELYDSLKDYPNNFYASDTQRRLIRNPFDKPLVSLNGSKTTPNIKVIGFAASVEQSSVFLKIGSSKEKAYKIGEEIGSGYRITQINMADKQIYISNGNEIFTYEIINSIKL